MPPLERVDSEFEDDDAAFHMTHPPDPSQAGPSTSTGKRSAPAFKAKVNKLARGMIDGEAGRGAALETREEEEDWADDDEAKKKKKTRLRITPEEYGAYLFHHRDGRSNHIIQSGRLAEELATDIYCSQVEANRLSYLYSHQEQLRASDYQVGGGRRVVPITFVP
jgi:hypothetical protein